MWAIVNTAHHTASESYQRHQRGCREGKLAVDRDIHPRIHPEASSRSASDENSALVQIQLTRLPRLAGRTRGEPAHFVLSSWLLMARFVRVR